MEDKKNTFIAFLDDDDQKKEDWITEVKKSPSYIEFNYRNKKITLPWNRILKLKEDCE